MSLKKEDEGRLPWFTLDARKSIEELRAEIQTIAEQTVARVQNNDLQRLW